MFAVCDNNDKVIHLIGIGGIGVSGIAEILHHLGYIVQGSDKSRSQNLERLEKLGIVVFVGHDAKNVGKADVVVYSSAIKPDNQELLYAKANKIPCLTRAEMLSQIVRFKKSIVVAGSHGKTTVTSICAAILEMASYNPTIVNGGVINSYKTNAKLGDGDWSVIESDESDGSFIHFFPTIGIITNIDKEHISHYKTFDNLKQAFKTFLNNIPFYGAGIVCVDDPNVCEVIRDTTDRRILTYSIDEDSQFKAVNIKKTTEGSTFDVIVKNSEILKGFEIPLFGDHNIRNSLSAIAMSYELKIDMNIVRAALLSFAGVGRRFTNVGEISGIKVIDDYAHHPTEIRALLDSARQVSKGKIVVICQPHRFTRLNTLFDEFSKCFDNADTIIIVPVYRADDCETAEITSNHLYEALLLQGKDTLFANDRNELETLLKDLVSEAKITKDDIILFSGAGSISKWAREITSSLGTSA